jgi:F420-dependent oxidoreductase-like protein
MIEGQEGVTWEQWLALARACEDFGLEGLFRSDHYAPIGGAPDAASLDAWATLAGLAARTERIRLGTLVSPATFRHPSVLAKMSATVDHISGGRVELGMGAGWYEEDHTRFGFEFPETSTRMEVLGEQLEIVHRQWSEDDFAFAGRHYGMEACFAEPKPLQRPHLPLIVGGSAGPLSARLCARWGDEYNTVYATPDECRQRRGRIAEAWEQEGRDPSRLRFSLMTRGLVGRDRAEASRRARHAMELQGREGDPEEWLGDETGVTGSVQECLDRLGALAEAGVDRVMLQHLGHDDLEMVELIGRELVPAVA